MAAPRDLWMDWFSYVAHEMRPPLNSALGWFRLIVEERSKTMAEQGEVDLERMLNTLGAQLETLTHLTEGLWLVHSAS